MTLDETRRPNGPMPQRRRKPPKRAEPAAWPSAYPATLGVGNCWVNTRHVIAVGVTDDHTIEIHLDTGRVLDTGATADPRALEEIIKTLSWE